MTFQPHGPENEPPVVTRERNGINTVAMSTVFLACTIVVVIVLYAVNRGEQTATTTSSPAVTTGQSQPAPESKAESTAEPKGETKSEPRADPKSEPKAK
jgi:hypothetical protein